MEKSQEFSPSTFNDGAVLWLVIAVAAANILIPSAAAQDRRVLQGKVESAEGGQSLGGARITTGAVSALTDDQGEFSLADLAPGSYTVRAELTGYLRETITLHIPADAAPGPLVIRMVRGAVVEGVVESPDGHPIGGAGVGLMRQVNTRWVGLLGLPVRTDADGRFEIRDIPPGTYYLRASATKPAMGTQPPTQPVQAVRDVYYPNSATFNGAAPIPLVAGAHLAGIRLRLLPPESYKVSGRVSGMPEKANLSVTLRETTFPGSTALMDFNLLMNKDPRGPVNANGEFAIEGVPPGYYNAVLLAGFQALGDAVAVTVMDRNVENLVFSTSQGTTLTGRIADPQERYSQGGMQVILEGTGPDGTLRLLTSVSRSGTFAFENVRPARYRLILYPARDFAVNQVEIGGKTIEGAIFDFHAAGGEEAVITVGKGGTIRGTIEIPGFPGMREEGVVTAVGAPADAALGIGEVHSASVQRDGSFQISALAPGEYRVCAWREQRGDFRAILEAPQYERQLERNCSTVRLARDGGVEVRVRAISFGDFR